MLALGGKPRLALSLDLTFKGRVVDCLALPVAHLAAPLLEEGLKDRAVNSVVGCATFWTSMSIVTSCDYYHLHQGYNKCLN